MKVAVDAMGGDHAPREVIKGAIMAVREHDLEIVLVGREDVVREELARAGAPAGFVDVVHAADVVEMSDSPGEAIRKKKDSSIRVGLSLVSEGKASSFMSAGNSGAVMAGALLILRKIRGVDRPAITATIPTPTGPIVLLDAGANVDCKPAHLFQFGCMGEAYARKMLGIAHPRVGVLSVGAEDSKGNDMVRETGALLREADMNFIGNVEGRDFFGGKADVFVCDGFVGNVALKTMEGMAFAIGQFLKHEIEQSPMAQIGALLAGGAIRKVKKRLDYAEYGGAPLLGVKGGVVICHGSSDARAIKNGIRAAASLHRFGVEEEIARAIAQVGI